MVLQSIISNTLIGYAVAIGGGLTILYPIPMLGIDDKDDPGLITLGRLFGVLTLVVGLYISTMSG